ncbi:RNA polymerase I-specific transcription initiation factor rrn11 [Hypsizygus marmoreus]|uniref:RNA polymerase I-specific transcription initiation factor rrn11 n=1 Tax=Hypsizygus marmoreus TaxID=39966 RepID=A0A369JSS2_HYPMA|nr:RNA polymerase I-specific transcription initiation factor rrn11 [Hypsizygus marmoreus]
MSFDNRLDDHFLFASLDSQKPLTARKVHIRRLYDLLQLCIHRNDLTRATRAWAILARCKEVHWMSMWTTGFLLLGANLDEDNRTHKRLEYLRTMMLRQQDDREHILQELIVQLILSGRHREALDELELYLPSFPYQDNPVLHVYAGLICLYLAQPVTSSGSAPFNAILLRDAQSHFDHAKGVDPDNVVAQGFLDKITDLSNIPRNNGNSAEHDSDDESMVLDDSPRRKRVRK